MPIYEYQCERCGRVTEALQRFSDPPPASCAHCGGPLKKLFSAPAFQFKGQGWYATDYAKKSGASGAGRSEGAAEGAGRSEGAAEGAGRSEGAAEGATRTETKEAPGKDAGSSPKSNAGSGAKPPAGE